VRACCVHGGAATTFREQGLGWLAKSPKIMKPQQIEPRWADFWVREQLFRADPSAPGPVFSIVIPPPNVTGSLHIGHMLDHPEIDILTRWHRMRGYNTLYLPGMDHAGISTQRVVVRELAAQGIDYRSLGREKIYPARMEMEGRERWTDHAADEADRGKLRLVSGEIYAFAGAFRAWCAWCSCSCMSRG